MPLYFDNFKNYPSEGFNSDLNIAGLDFFRNQLEKHFFSTVTVRNCPTCKTTVQLSIELDCNLSLVEMLFHFNKGAWGNFGRNGFSLERLLHGLSEDNGFEVDIDEFTVFLKDTSIVVTKIYDQSISDQLRNIFSEIGQHYVHFSKGLTETPYEIYVPVFEEECSNGDENLLRNIQAGNHSKNDYFKYWGLYCESEEDAVIYDLKNKCIERGDLFMLNQ